MAERPLYQAIAEAFHAEGVRTHFTLMGDGNMHLAIALGKQPSVRLIHARHENCACSMALGHALEAGEVGTASVTMGPGYTQAITALITATRGRVPLVVFVGDTPSNGAWHLQRLDIKAFSAGSGVQHIAVTDKDRALACVAEAFRIARADRRPVVLSVPMDIQKQAMAGGDAYEPIPLPPSPPIFPAAADVERLAALIRGAGRPIFIAGRGAVLCGAGPAIERLADRAGALLATTLPARGLFRGSSRAIGIAGGFATTLARQCFARSDLVVAFGASLSTHTTDGGKLFPQAHVVKVDRRPGAIRLGRQIASDPIRSGAGEAIGVLLDAIPARAKGGWKDVLGAMPADLFADDQPIAVEPGTVDPRAAMRVLDAIIPKDWSVVASTGHCFYFSAARFHHRPPERLHSVLDFGAIGSNLAYAIGVAAARGDGKVVLFDGDGSFLMHIQELETVRRHGIRLLVVVLNDGAYGAEFHKLRAEGLDPGETVFGRGSLAAVAAGFGLRSATVTDTADLAGLFAAHAAEAEAEVWDLHVSANVVSDYYRHEHFGGREPELLG